MKPSSEKRSDQNWAVRTPSSSTIAKFSITLMPHTHQQQQADAVLANASPVTIQVINVPDTIVIYFLI
uniref:Uncharacterized protein n=1 Tax=Candidatus Kentrum sp. LPFa TaxID=2126335 RepID=A0A450W0J6_9GAMM|nr:MAG: hypothetical protein BECKLPF1236A_GA0070988_100406 [Candidatus Kentron sp. LPFa]VFK27142.1 MAG: hypothetical protein BECKLPF1236C_GA0070990_100436 [Candidatus Kentron sp. LPFa]